MCQYANVHAGVALVGDFRQDPGKTRDKSSLSFSAMLLLLIVDLTMTKVVPAN